VGGTGAEVLGDFLGGWKGGEDSAFAGLPWGRGARAARFALRRRSGGAHGIGPMGAAGEFGFQRLGEAKAAGEACEHHADLHGAEAVRDPEAGLGEVGIALQGGGEFLAEGEEGLDDAEEAGGAGGYGGGRPVLAGIGVLGWLSDVCRGGHGW